MRWFVPFIVGLFLSVLLATSTGCVNLFCPPDGRDEYDCGMNGVMKDCHCLPITEPAYGSYPAPTPSSDPAPTPSSEGDASIGPMGSLQTDAAADTDAMTIVTDDAGADGDADAG